MIDRRDYKRVFWRRVADGFEAKEEDLKVRKLCIFAPLSLELFQHKVLVCYQTDGKRF